MTLPPLDPSLVLVKLWLPYKLSNFHTLSFVQFQDGSGSFSTLASIHPRVTFLLQALLTIVLESFKFSCLLGFLLCTQRLKIVQPIISSLGCFLYVGWVCRHLFSFYSGLLTRFQKCLWIILFSFLVILFLCMKKESRFSVIMHTQSLKFGVITWPKCKKHP